MAFNFPRRPRDSVIRQPRREQLQPTYSEPSPTRHPHRVFSSPYILFFGFVALIVIGGLLLSLPLASTQGVPTPLDQSFFTATSAVTVTGLTVVHTGTYWSFFGQLVIFLLMLVGGLSFMAVGTFILAFLRQRSSLSERLVLRESMGVNRMGGLRNIARNIVLVALVIYLAGAGAIFWYIHGLDSMGVAESIWQSLFLSVSAFNNAGFSILPEGMEGTSLARMANQPLFLFLVMALIILGGIGWTTLVDLYQHRGFSRLTLDSKLVIVTSLFLWVAGALVMLLAEYLNHSTLYALGEPHRVINALFQSVSGRTAGLSTIEFDMASDFTKLTFPILMFIGGASGSVAGGIKINTFAIIVVAVISSIRMRPEAEAFKREIAHGQVMRALTVGVLGVMFIMVVMPLLTVTDSHLDFFDLLFDAVSAFGTTGLSTGIVPHLSLAGKIIFMLTMLIGRLGPMTLALALAPREQTVYRFMQERVTIG